MPDQDATRAGTLVAVLSAHRIIRRAKRRQQHGESYDVIMCACLWQGLTENEHRAHVADRLLAAQPPGEALVKAALVNRVNVLFASLKSVEWAGNSFPPGDPYSVCPACHSEHRLGHGTVTVVVDRQAVQRPCPLKVALSEAAYNSPEEIPHA